MERGQEKGLVDLPVEDRDAPFDTFGYHISAIQTRLMRELRGRQVNGHRSLPPCDDYYMSDSIARPADARKNLDNFVKDRFPDPRRRLVGRPPGPVSGG
jgi:hypothetical protein